MNRVIRWNKRRILIVILISSIVYFYLSSRYNKYEQDVVIRNVQPETVWDYVADFSNMKLLNPTM